MADPESAEASGWDAIDGAIELLYPDQEPLHFGTIVPYMLGGNDPLQGISAYRSEAGGVAHWHFLTYGFSELYDKESEEPEVSGWGFELTFRLRRAPEEEQPPNWALSFLQNLGRYVFSSGNSFDAGHHMNLNGPIALDSDTAVTAICFHPDPELPASVSSPNGEFALLQIVGLTHAEHALIESWNTGRFVEFLRERDPLLITDLDRQSFYGDADFERQLQGVADAEPSSTASLFISRFTVERAETTTVTMGANSVASFKLVLRKRLPFDLPLSVVTEDGRTVLTPAVDGDATLDEEGVVSVPLNREQVTGLLDALQPKAGCYPIDDRLVVVVEKTEITDAEGNVVRTVG